MQARKQHVKLEAFGRLSPTQQEMVLHMPVMQYLSKSKLPCGALQLQGDKHLVQQISYCSVHSHSAECLKGVSC